MMCLRCMLFVAKSICLNHSESVDATVKLELRSKYYSGHYRRTCRLERSPHNPKPRMCAQGTTVFSHTKGKEGGWWRAADALLNHKPDMIQSISCLLSTTQDPHFLVQLEIAETNSCFFSRPQISSYTKRSQSPTHTQHQETNTWRREHTATETSKREAHRRQDLAARANHKPYSNTARHEELPRNQTPRNARYLT